MFVRPRRSPRAVVVAAIAALALFALPAAAITDGELDGNGHPYVGLLTAQDENGIYLWRCSATLLSPTVVLTAGHCTEAPAAHAEIFFDSGPIAVDPAFNPATRDCAGVTGYPCQGDAGGTPHTHPDYNPSAFFLRDLGIVALDSPMAMAEYGQLPTLDQLDALKTRRGKQETRFTAVGYGLQKINPVFIESARVRMVAHPKLNQINAPGFTGDFSLLLSNNHATGGTCFGDSGGPNFLYGTNVIAGVTSFGLNGNCAGTGGVFRVDRSWSLDWIQTFLGP